MATTFSRRALNLAIHCLILVADNFFHSFLRALMRDSRLGCLDLFTLCLWAGVPSWVKMYLLSVQVLVLLR